MVRQAVVNMAAQHFRIARELLGKRSVVDAKPLELVSQNPFEICVVYKNRYSAGHNRLSQKTGDAFIGLGRPPLHNL